MMTALQAVLALITLLNKVLTLAKSYQDRAAGRAEAIIMATQHVQAMVDQAAAIRAAAGKRDAGPGELRKANPHSRT